MRDFILKYLNISMKRIIIFLLFSFALPAILSQNVFAQQQVLQQNLSNVKVDELSNKQLLDIKVQLNNAGVKDDQLRDVLVSRGMQGDEADKFITRISNIKDDRGSTDIDNNPNAINTVSGVQTNSYELTNDALDSVEAKIYGMSLFTQSNSPMNPNLNMTPPANYILGPKDQMAIDVTGNSVVHWDVSVTPGGYIIIPEGIGKVYVGGKTLDDASDLIRAKLRANNYQVGNGTNVDVTITNIRTINVTIMGEVRKQGSYPVSSLYTVFNALYLSGGPTKNGSFRNIQVIRDHQVVETLDIYDFLQEGDASGNIQLQDNDIIRVPVYDVRVEVSGEVKRPGLYEALPGETLKKIILFAGGVTDQAYVSRIKIIQATDKEKRVEDIDYRDVDNYIPLRGDHIIVNPILDRFENRVTINGAVFRPGEYQLTDGLTLKQLIGKAEGLKEDAYLARGYITRLKPDNTQELVSFNVQEIENGSKDITLKREDVVTIPSLFDLKDNPMITVLGRVRKPGQLPLMEGMTVKDAVLLSGGFSEGANLNRIEVARRVKDSDRSKRDADMAKVFQVDVDKSLSTAGMEFALEPYDIVSIYSLPGYETQKNITVEGEVMYPGNYTLLKKNERISDVVMRAGNFTPFAYLDGASLKRKEIPDTRGEQQLEQLKKDQIISAQQEAVDSNGAKVNLTNPTVRNDFVGIDLAYIMAHPKSNQDLILEEGDLLTIPKLMQTVRISGEVLLPTTILFEPGKNLHEYIIGSGGYTQDALKRKTRVVAANGKAAKTRSFLFFKRYPRIKPGSEIYVPQKKQNTGEQMSPQAWIGLGTSLASLAAIIFAIVNNSN